MTETMFLSGECALDPCPFTALISNGTIVLLTSSKESSSNEGGSCTDIISFVDVLQAIVDLNRKRKHRSESSCGGASKKSTTGSFDLRDDEDQSKNVDLDDEVQVEKEAEQPLEEPLKMPMLKKIVKKVRLFDQN